MSEIFHSPFVSYRLPSFGNFDLYATFSGSICIVEVELKRADPVNNIAKIYRYLEENGSELKGKKLIFVHAYSPYYYKGGTLTKRKNAEFIGNKMSKEYKNVAYISVEFDSMDSLKSNVVNAIKMES